MIYRLFRPLAVFVSLAFLVSPRLVEAQSPAPAPAPSDRGVQHLTVRSSADERLEVELRPVGLTTIVHVRSTYPKRRPLLLKSGKELLDLRSGDCSSGTQGARFPLNPIVDGQSETRLSVPISTLLGKTHRIVTRYPDGSMLTCGAI